MNNKRERLGKPRLVALGDRFHMYDVKGIIVADLANRAFAAGYPEVDWAYLADGYLVLDHAIGLVHVPAAKDLPDEGQLRPLAKDGRGTHAGGLRAIMLEEFAAYDGRSPTILSEISIRYRDRAGFLETLIELVGDKDRLISEGVTWVLKSELDNGRRLDDDLTSRLIAAVDTVTAWQAQLHICQVVAYLKVPERACLPLRQWLIQRLDADRPFLRAWALDGLCHLPDVPVSSLLDRMADDPSASVRARVKNLRRQLTERGVP